MYVFKICKTKMKDTITVWTYIFHIGWLASMLKGSYCSWNTSSKHISGDVPWGHRVIQHQTPSPRWPSRGWLARLIGTHFSPWTSSLDPEPYRGFLSCFGGIFDGFAPCYSCDIGLTCVLYVWPWSSDIKGPLVVTAAACINPTVCLAAPKISLYSADKLQAFVTALLPGVRQYFLASSIVFSCKIVPTLNVV